MTSRRLNCPLMHLNSPRLRRQSTLMLTRRTRHNSRRHLTVAVVRMLDGWIGYGSSKVACRNHRKRSLNHQRLSRVHYRVRSLSDIHNRHRLRHRKRPMMVSIPSRKSWFCRILLQRLSQSPKWPCGVIWLVQSTAPSLQRSDQAPVLSINPGINFVSVA